MWSGPIKCLVCSVHHWQSSVGNAPPPRQFGDFCIKTQSQLSYHWFLCLVTATLWLQCSFLFRITLSLEEGTDETYRPTDASQFKENDFPLPRNHEGKPSLHGLPIQTLGQILLCHSRQNKVLSKLTNPPATLTFSELVAMGVAVTVLLVRLPPVPL